MAQKRAVEREVIVERPKRRSRRAYSLRRGFKRMRRKKGEVGLFDVLGVSMGLGLSAFSPNGASLSGEAWSSDPKTQLQNVANGIIAGVTGYNPNTHEWKMGNLGDFWLPTIGFHIVDVILKKFGMNNLRIHKNLKMA